MLRKGFTLIELLVVIAIIGILATIIIINVAGARTKAVDSKAFSDLQQSAKIASMCTTNDEAVTQPGSTGVICTDSTLATGNWPVLTDGTYGDWAYSTGTGNAASTAEGADDWALAADNSAASANNDKTITCDMNGCKKDKF